MNHKTIKTLLIIAALITAIALRSQAQTVVKKVGNTLVTNNAAALNSDTSITKNSEKTEFTFTIPSGEVLPVFKSVPGGKYYVVRKSKETLRLYRQYLKIEG